MKRKLIVGFFAFLLFGSVASANSNVKKARDFFEAFQRGDHQALMSHYSKDGPQGEFLYSDPIFGELNPFETSVMWGILIAGAPAIKINSIKEVSPGTVEVDWVAKYTSPYPSGAALGLEVENHIISTLLMDDDGIYQQTDKYNERKWVTMAVAEVKRGPMSVEEGLTRATGFARGLILIQKQCLMRSGQKCSRTEVAKHFACLKETGRICPISNQ